MRALALAFLASLALAPAALAQDACSQATPCTWFVLVDETGLYAGTEPPAFNATRGDWYTLNATNLDLDGVPHTITLQGYGLRLVVPPDDAAESAPIQLATAGTFRLQDERGRGGTVLVTPGDVNDLDAGLVDASGGTVSAATQAAPAPALLLAAATLLAVAGARRRA